MLHGVAVCVCLHIQALGEKLAGSYSELTVAFKTSLEGLARTVQDLHAILKCAASLG